MNLGQVAKMVQGTARGGGPTTWVRRSPWGGAVGRFWNPETKIPCSAPPFGELVAVDVNRGEMAWKVPLGFVESLKAKGFDKTGTLNIGGSIATAGGLIFIGATIDCRFRAFESRTGKQLWETELAGVRAHDADDVPRQGRPPVRRRGRRRRQLSRRGARNEDRRVRAPR